MKQKLEKKFMVRMATEDHDWLIKMAEKEDRSISNVVRRLIRAQRESGASDLLEACKKVLELVRDTQFLDHPTMEFVAAAVRRAEGEKS